MLTVNESIANWYHKLYNVNPWVLRNISEKRAAITKKSRIELGLPEHAFIVIIQGSGININRGNEEVLQAFEKLDSNFLLLIIGSGDVLPALKQHAIDKNMRNVLFHPKMPYGELMQYTAACNLGISMDKDTNLNYKYSLPNKVFDFIHAGIPVLASNLPEIARIVNTYQTGTLIDSHDPNMIAGKIAALRNDTAQMEKFKLNCMKASEELN
ncbi:MAG TPA: glycosyltransferase, partial [Flavobacteriales bacterium]|nr:glycosyltransferase [Flavobacteriales bacterium]